MYDIDRHLPGHPALGSTKLEIAPGQRATPGAAVGVWFIPVANLVLGYRTVRHLWRESQPAPTLVPNGVILPSSTPLLSWWWGLFVARNVGSRLFAVGAPNANTLAGWVALTERMIVPKLLSVSAAILCILVVRTIEYRQAEQHRDLLLRVPVTPPSDQLR